MKERILTGDRITGKLHLSHYVGSFKNRVELQTQYEAFLILADVQALTTHFEKTESIKQSGSHRTWISRYVLRISGLPRKPGS